MSQHPSRQPRNSRKQSAAQPQQGAPRSRSTARPQRSGEQAADARGGAARRDKGAAASPRGGKDFSERGRSGQGAAGGRSDSRGQQRSAPRAGRGAERAADTGGRDSKPHREREGAKPRHSRDAGERQEYSPRRGGSAGAGRRDAERAPERSDSGREPFTKAGAAGSAAGKERYPKSDFARREGMLEGLPAVMTVNRSLKGYAFKKEFPWCLRLVVAYRADEESGLPLPKEERVLEAFEQNLFGLLKRVVNGHYVGYTNWSGTREFVFYVDEGSEAEDPLNDFAEKQKRELEFALDDDPRWERAAHYFDYRD